MSDVMDEVEEELNEFGHSLRQLTAEEITKLKSDTNLVPKFHQNKFEKEAKKNWDLFYKRNTNKFFKNRHWTTREFEELITNTSDSTSNNSIENSLKRLCLNECDNQDERLNSSSDKMRNLLEVGCGVGNLIWPLIEEGTKLFIYACDFSSKAIDLLKKNPLYDESKCYAFEVDITQVNMNENNQDDDSEDNRYSTISSCLPHGVMIDIVSLVFVLSAIHPDKMETALKNIYQVKLNFIFISIVPIVLILKGFNDLLIVK